jgi:alkaline phosphatase
MTCCREVRVTSVYTQKRGNHDNEDTLARQYNAPSSINRTEGTTHGQVIQMLCDTINSGTEPKSGLTSYNNEELGS